MTWYQPCTSCRGMQFFVVMLIAGLMFKSLGVSNELIARWTGVLGLAWALKPLWALPRTGAQQEAIVVATQLTGAMCLGLMAVALHLPAWFGAALVVLFLIAYASATHDIACDGLYMGALDAKQQAAFAGWQGAFFNAARFITGVILKVAGGWKAAWGAANAWSTVFAGLALLVLLLAATTRMLPGNGQH